MFTSLGVEFFRVTLRDREGVHLTLPPHIADLFPKLCTPKNMVSPVQVKSVIYYGACYIFGQWG